MLQSKRGGFTFVEVLVVVGIIAVVAAIGYAISGPAREKARQSVCANQLRQLHAAVMMYTADVDAGEEVPGLGSFSAQVARTGVRVLLPYLKSESLCYCPDLPAQLKSKIASSYVWVPLPLDALPSPTPGEKGMLLEQESRITRVGSAFPMWMCDIHDQVYYQPKDRGVDFALTEPYILEISVSGSLSSGRRPYRRTRTLEGWALLP